MAIEIFYPKELTAGMIKSGIKMDHHSVRVITDNEGVTFLMFVNQGYLHSMVLFCTTTKR